MNAADIIAFRLGLGLTQAQLAKLVGASQGQVSRWEKGTSLPRYANLSRLRKLPRTREALAALCPEVFTGSLDLEPRGRASRPGRGPYRKHGSSSSDSHTPSADET
jgi:transcriptional regulator with XRE-family HTH domain